MDLKQLYWHLRSEGVKLFRHRTRKTHEPYAVIGEAEAQCSDWNIYDGEPCIVYTDSQGKLWVRNKAEFEDGRFYEVNE